MVVLPSAAPFPDWDMVIHCHAAAAGARHGPISAGPSLSGAERRARRLKLDLLMSEGLRGWETGKDNLNCDFTCSGLSRG